MKKILLSCLLLNSSCTFGMFESVDADFSNNIKRVIVYGVSGTTWAAIALLTDNIPLRTAALLLSAAGAGKAFYTLGCGVEQVLDTSINGSSKKSDKDDV